MRMTWILSLALAGGLLVAAPAAARAGDLTLHDLIALHRAGLGDEVLVPLIEVDGGPFELTEADLLDLKAHGLSDRVIGALVRAGRGDGHAAPACGEEASAGASSHLDGCSDAVVTAVPVAVPVYIHVPRRHHRHGHRDAALPPFESSLGPRTRPGPAGAARATGRPGAPTVDDIRHAPKGFHPGELGPRATTDTGAAKAGARTRASGRADTPDTGRSVTPGIARGAAPDHVRSHGVARGRADDRR
jgi:hypothetical protein